MNTLRGCPDAEMLSAYLDGKLDAALRGPLEDHISRCEECYFVVRETALTWPDSAEASAPLGGADAPERGAVVAGTFGAVTGAAVEVRDPAVEEPGTIVPAPVPASAPSAQGLATAPRPARSLMASYALPLAAALVVGVGAIALWKQARPEAQDPRAALVAAVGERRFFDARLTGGFKYGERISPKRSGGTPVVGGGATGPAAEDWEILAAAAKIKKDIGAPTTAEERATLAAASLVLGDVGDAVRLLEQAAADPPDGVLAHAHLLSDLSAAYLTRAMQEGATRDYSLALQSATRAIALAPSLTEALFNRALAEAHLNPSRAAEAWDGFLAREKEPGWRQEALKQRGMLEDQAPIP